MEQMSLEAIMQLVNTTGFPIFVALYLLIRNERAIKEFTNVMKRIEGVLALEKGGYRSGQK